MMHNPIIAALVVLFVVLLVAGFVAWLINTLYPAENPYKRAALGTLAAIVVVVICVLAFRLLTGQAVAFR